MLWAEIEIEARGDDQEPAGALLTEIAGCHGYSATEPGVLGYLPIDDRLEGALLRLRDALGRTITIRRKVAEEDWAHAWKQYFKPQRIGKCIVINALVNHAPLGGLFGTNALAQHHHLRSTWFADQARQHPAGTAIGNQPNIHKRLKEIGTARGKHKIAGKRE